MPTSTQKRYIVNGEVIYGGPCDGAAPVMSWITREDGSRAPIIEHWRRCKVQSQTGTAMTLVPQSNICLDVWAPDYSAKKTSPVVMSAKNEFFDPKISQELQRQLTANGDKTRPGRCILESISIKDTAGGTSADPSFYAAPTREAITSDHSKVLPATFRFRPASDEEQASYHFENDHWAVTERCMDLYNQLEKMIQ